MELNATNVTVQGLIKKEYETLYNIIGHKYDDVGDNAEVSDFRLPNVKGWCIRIK